MVRRFATSGNTIDVGLGPAGSGKTAVMAVISELAALTGTPIVGTALAAKAAAGLETATGIPSTTLTRLLNQAGQGNSLPSGAVVVVDEAGMVGTRQLAAVSDLVEQADGKLVLIGDDRQLPEIDAGGLFAALARRLPTVELTDNVRQNEPWERVALTELRDGSVDRAVGLYRQNQRITIGHNRHDTITRAVDDWYRHVAATADLTSGLLIAHDNDTVTELNEQARNLLAAARRLHGPTLEKGQRVFQAGDRILCRQNQHRLGVLNGDLGTIIAIDPDRGRVRIRLDREPEHREGPAWYLDGKNVDYGYALTGHKAQGVTTGRSFTVVTGATDREWTYVALSRGRQANRLYFANAEPCNEHCTHITHRDRSDAIDALVASLGRSAAEAAAIDQYLESSTDVDIDTLALPPPSSDIAERVAWIIAQRRTERNQLEHPTHGIALAANR
jgi:ATP-dependent exoDNAse (exonuclease V) alpha subunit